MSQKHTQESLKDLLLTIPNFQDYTMIDWWILALWVYAVLSTAKNFQRKLLLISIVELLWGVYDISISEYAQSILFFSNALVLYFLSLHKQQESLQ